MNDPIRERMEVVGSDGQHVGTFDRLEADKRIRLMQDGAPDGADHFVPLAWITHVDAAIHLNRPAGEVLSMT
jgi:hypothetical protein